MLKDPQFNEAMALFLTPWDVPVGVTVYSCLPGMVEPAFQDNGELVPPLKKMLWRPGSEPKFYPVVDGAIVPGAGMHVDGWAEGSRFMPVDVFTADDAPDWTDFAVFVDGRKVFVDEVSVVKVGEHFFTFNHGIRDDADKILPGRGSLGWRCREYSLPVGALLVPTSPVEKSPRKADGESWVAAIILVMHHTMPPDLLRLFAALAHDAKGVDPVGYIKELSGAALGALAGLGVTVVDGHGELRLSHLGKRVLVVVRSLDDPLGHVQEADVSEVTKAAQRVRPQLDLIEAINQAYSEE